MTEKKYLRPLEAAVYLSVCEQTVYNWINSGKLRSSKVDRLRFIKVSDIDALISSRVASHPMEAA